MEGLHQLSDAIDMNWRCCVAMSGMAAILNHSLAGEEAHAGVSSAMIRRTETAMGLGALAGKVSVPAAAAMMFWFRRSCGRPLSGRCVVGNDAGPEISPGWRRIWRALAAV
jgi:hypothetical protein